MQLNFLGICSPSTLVKLHFVNECSVSSYIHILFGNSLVFSLSFYVEFLLSVCSYFGIEHLFPEE